MLTDEPAGDADALVLPTGFARALWRMPMSATGRALRALSLLVARQLVHDIERFGRDVTLHVVPPLCPVDTSPYDYSASSSLIDRASESTRERIRESGSRARTACRTR